MPNEETAQVATGDSQPLREVIDRVVSTVERALLDDQPCRPLDGCQGEFFQAGQKGADLGRQRRHGRNPAASAAAALGRNSTLRRKGNLTGQTHRQYTPVVRTPMKNRPSNAGSRTSQARSNSVSCSGFMGNA